MSKYLRDMNTDGASQACLYILAFIQEGARYTDLLVASWACSCLSRVIRYIAVWTFVTAFPNLLPDAKAVSTNLPPN